MAKFFTALFFLVILSPIYAQELLVKTMKLLPTDIYASVNKRIDGNDNPCALIRVSLPIKNVTFSGNIVGDVVNDGSDYLVYMINGAKKLRINHPDYRSIEINFNDYGIKSLMGAATYCISIEKTDETSTKYQTLHLKVTPPDAIFLIDGNLVEQNTINLKVGTHKYNVVSKDYYPQEGTIEIKEDIPSKLIVELLKKQIKSNDEQDNYNFKNNDSTIKEDSSYSLITESNFAKNLLGIDIEAISEETKKHLEITYGVEVNHLYDGPFKNCGIHVGFVIQEINGIRVCSRKELFDIINSVLISYAKDKVLYIRGILRSGKKAYYAVPFNYTLGSLKMRKGLYPHYKDIAFYNITTRM